MIDTEENSFLIIYEKSLAFIRISLGFLISDSNYFLGTVKLLLYNFNSNDSLLISASHDFTIKINYFVYFNFCYPIFY